jgi:hypothetical protein
VWKTRVHKVKIVLDLAVLKSLRLIHIELAFNALESDATDQYVPLITQPIFSLNQLVEYLQGWQEEWILHDLEQQKTAKFSLF